MTPPAYHGVSCARDGCGWTGRTVGEYEAHANNKHEGRL